MPNDDIADMLRSIGVRGSREALLALTAHATSARFSPTQTFEELVALARCQRDQRNLAARTKAATLGTLKPLDRFDWNHPRIIPREDIERLTTLAFIAQGHNILLRGLSGVGKAMLAQNLVGLVRSADRRRRVRFSRRARSRSCGTPRSISSDEHGHLPANHQGQKPADLQGRLQQLVRVGGSSSAWEAARPRGSQLIPVRASSSP
jgi:hypothetical protein